MGTLLPQDGILSLGEVWTGQEFDCIDKTKIVVLLTNNWMD